MRLRFKSLERWLLKMAESEVDEARAAMRDIDNVLRFRVECSDDGSIHSKVDERVDMRREMRKCRQVVSDIREAITTLRRMA